MMIIATNNHTTISKAVTTTFLLLLLLVKCSEQRLLQPAPPPQKTVIGFTVSCSANNPNSAGLDCGDAYVFFSVHFPGMDYVYEFVTHVRGKNDGTGDPGDDTREVAQKMKQDLDNGYCPHCDDNHLSQTHRDKIKIQWDGGPRGNARARIVIQGADHINFAVAGDKGKIRWRAMTQPRPKSTTKPVKVPTIYTGSGTEAYTDKENKQNELRAKNTVVHPNLVRVDQPVPSPKAKPPAGTKIQSSEKFRDLEKLKDKPNSENGGIYLDETRNGGWKDP